MKKRNGFVSNSSSASFVVHWRFRDFGQVISKEEIIKQLRGWAGWDSENQKELEDMEFIETIMDRTTENENGTFTTTFFTSCLNSVDDFGKEAQLFVFSLVCKGDFEIIDSELHDG